MITRIEANNYRSLEQMEVNLPPYAVLVGANGAGKSTLLDIPGLLKDCLSQNNIGQAFTLRQNHQPARCSHLKELIFGGKGTHFALAVEAEMPDHIVETLVPIQSATAQKAPENQFRFIRYEVEFTICSPQDLEVSNENLFLFSQADTPDRSKSIQDNFPIKKTWRTILQRPQGHRASFKVETKKNAKSKAAHVEAHRLALPRVTFESAEDFPAASWFHDLLSQGSVFYQPDLPLLQTASPPGLPKTLMSNAANLPWLALELQKNETRFALWVEHVCTALPQISGICVKEREEDHHAYFVVSHHGGYEVTSSGLSEGTLRVMALTLLPYLSQLPTLIITEEPETGVHPGAIEAVLQSLSSVYDSQVLISSHSPVVLAQSQLKQILCARLAKNGVASIIAGPDHPRLKNWQGQIDLGAL